jgi:hypothetical protein
MCGLFGNYRGKIYRGKFPQGINPCACAGGKAKTAFGIAYLKVAGGISSLQSEIGFFEAKIGGPM